MWGPATKKSAKSGFFSTLLDNGQFEAEGRALSQFGFGPDSAVVTIDYLLGNGKSKAGSFFFGYRFRGKHKEGRKDLCQILTGHSQTYLVTSFSIVSLLVRTTNICHRHTRTKPGQNPWTRKNKKSAFVCVGPWLNA
jgi:hypothetical protein